MTTIQEVKDDEETNVEVLSNVTNTDETQQETEVQTEEQKEDETDDEVINFVLNKLGLKEEFPEIFNFEENLDLDTREGVEEVINKSIELGSNLLMERIKEDDLLYSFMLHRANGGDLHTFNTNKIIVNDTEEIKNNISLQKSIAFDFYKEKGLDDDVVNSIVDKLITDEKLESTSLKINDENSKKIKEENDKILLENKQKQQLEESTKAEVVSELTSIINSNNFDGIQLSKKEREDLFNDICDFMLVNGNETNYIIPVTKDNLKTVVQNHLFLLKPELKEKLVTKNVSSQKVLSLKDKIKQKNTKVVIDEKEKEATHDEMMINFKLGNR